MSEEKTLKQKMNMTQLQVKEIKKKLKRKKIVQGKRGAKDIFKIKFKKKENSRKKNAISKKKN